MQNKEEKNGKNANEEIKENSDGKIHMENGKKISVIENMRQIGEREKKAQIEEESKKAEMLAEKERAEREKYAKKLANDKIELMKIKQGIISEEEFPKEEKEERVYTTGEKIGNFFYHNKMYIIIGTIIAIVAIFLIYDIVTNKSPDVSIMIIASDDEFDLRTEDIEKLFEPYCDDFNGDGEVYVRVSYMPAVVDTSGGYADMYYSSSYQTKLVAEFQGETSIMVIADEYTCETVNIEDGVLADMTEIYPDDENAVTLGYMLSGTDFGEDIKYSSMPDDLFMGFRVPTSGIGVNEEKFQSNYENALKMWDNYLTGTTVETNAKYHSVTGR